MSIENDLAKTKDLDKENKSSDKSQGILRYPSKGEQTVFSLFGIELTAPAGLKNPGIVYLSFIVINFILFLILRSFINV